MYLGGEGRERDGRKREGGVKLQGCVLRSSDVMDAAILKGRGRRVWHSETLKFCFGTKEGRMRMGMWGGREEGCVRVGMRGGREEGCVRVGMWGGREEGCVRVGMWGGREEGRWE